MNWLWSDDRVRVELERVAGVITSVTVAGAASELAGPAGLVNRFLRHLLDSGCSPNTAAAYGYDLRYLLEFLEEQGLGWEEIRPGRRRWSCWVWLRRRPSRRPAQRLGLSLSSGAGAAAGTGDGGAGAGGCVEFLRVGDIGRGV